MSETTDTVIKYEVNEVRAGTYEVKQLEPEKPSDLNSGSRKEFSFDVKVFSVRLPILNSTQQH